MILLDFMFSTNRRRPSSNNNNNNNNNSNEELGMEEEETTTTRPSNQQNKVTNSSPIPVPVPVPVPLPTKLNNKKNNKIAPTPAPAVVVPSMIQNMAKVEQKPRSDLLQFCLNMWVQLKTFHWQTYSYPRHKAVDSSLEKLSDLMDRFVETYQGRYKMRFSPIAGKNDKIDIKNHSEQTIDEYIDQAIQFLSTSFSQYVDEKRDTDLINIRDEMIGELHQLRYLFTLK